MIDEWKRDRSSLRKQMDEVRNYIESHPNADQYQGGRAKLRILLNQLALAERKVHHKIRDYEEQERLSEIVSNMSGLTEAETANLMRELERFKLVNV